MRAWQSNDMHFFETTVNGSVPAASGGAEEEQKTQQANEQKERKSTSQSPQTMTASTLSNTRK